MVVGHPKHWRATAELLRRAGASILAFHDLLFESRRLLFAGRPVWRGRWSGPLAHRPVVFAGPVHKRYFDGPPAEVQRCRWPEPLTPWKQRAQHTPDLASHIEALAQIWAELADEDSRAVFASVVRGRSAGDGGTGGG